MTSVNDFLFIKFWEFILHYFLCAFISFSFKAQIWFVLMNLWVELEMIVYSCHTYGFRNVS